MADAVDDAWEASADGSDSASEASTAHSDSGDESVGSERAAELDAELEAELVLSPEDEVCQVCSSGEDDSKMILCDACDKGFHIYCLEPPLKRIPAGDWFCPECKGAETSDSDDASTEASEEEDVGY